MQCCTNSLSMANNIVPLVLPFLIDDNDSNSVVNSDGENDNSDGKFSYNNEDNSGNNDDEDSDNDDNNYNDTYNKGDKNHENH